MKILLVEDREVQAKRYLEEIESLGHEVILAQNGIAAYHLVRKPLRFDAIITDMQMPCGTGLEFIEMLHEDSCTIPCRLHSSDSFYMQAGKRIELSDAIAGFPFVSFASKVAFGHIREFLDEVEAQLS